MQISELLENITKEPLPIYEIASVTEDTRTATADSLFVCIRGARFDGHTLAPKAYDSGCRFFVAEEALQLPSDATVVRVPNTRVALAQIACTFYRHPSHDLHIIGITGTKGKTTTACLIRSVLNDGGIPCGYIGTNGILYGNVRQTTKNTTPDALTLQKTLAEMRDAGMKAVALEVSSQALYQNRVEGMRFQTTVFTNLSNDHIGPNEHPTPEHYRACKHRLFTDFNAAHAVWNADEPETKAMQEGSSASHFLSYSACGASADVSAYDVRPEQKNGTLGISFVMKYKGKELPCHLPLIGACNVSNALCTAAIALGVFGLSAEQTVHALSRATVEGRSECIPLPSGAVAVIDYAHNRESLHQILASLREYRPRRLLCLFGSVGERTQLRRRDLAEVSASLADMCILTSDNPGNEPPENIIDEIASYLPHGFPHMKIPNREEAIRYALSSAQRGDILLLAGKGHENYQLIGSQKHPFNERKIIQSFISDVVFT